MTSSSQKREDEGIEKLVFKMEKHCIELNGGSAVTKGAGTER